MGIVETGAAKKYAELVVFSFLAAYLFYRLASDIMLKQIKESTQYNILCPYDDELMEAVKRKDYALQASIRAAVYPASTHEKKAERKLQWITAVMGLIGPIIAALIGHIVFGK